MTEAVATVLTTYVPSSLDRDTLRAESLALLSRLGIEPFPAIEPGKATIGESWFPRTPLENYSLANDREAEPICWHRDGHLGYRPPKILFWSSTLPIEIMNGNYSEAFISKPFDVVLFSNAEGYHRMPPEARDCRERWSLRFWCL